MSLTHPDNMMDLCGRQVLAAFRIFRENQTAPDAYLLLREAMILDQQLEQFQISLGKTQAVEPGEHAKENPRIDSAPYNHESGESQREPTITTAPAEPKAEAYSHPDQSRPDLSCGLDPAKQEIGWGEESFSPLVRHPARDPETQPPPHQAEQQSPPSLVRRVSMHLKIGGSDPWSSRESSTLFLPKKSGSAPI